MFETKSKPVPITYSMVEEAYQRVKSNQGTSGVDNESLELFRANESSKLYVLWNRLSSGSYFPKPLKRVSIPKGNGTERNLGIPTVSDRIAQQVVKSYIEPRLERVFSESSYGYRPQKNAHEALEAVTANIRQNAWVIDMDIKSFFDELNHELLQKALAHHVSEPWIKMYIKRWLECPSQIMDVTLRASNGKGTPQGGVISPLLANLFLHYAIDKWMMKNHPTIKFVRYADDIVVHCQTLEEAKILLSSIRDRLSNCKLSLNEEKTKLVYCKDYRRGNQDKTKEVYPEGFDFLGYSFKPRTVKSKTGKLFLGYGCAISQKSQSRILSGWKQSNWHRRSTLTIQDIANEVNPQMRGLIRYYGKYKLWEMQGLMWHFENRLAKWVLNKYKKLKRSYTKAHQWIKAMKASYPTMFYYWTIFKHV